MKVEEVKIEDLKPYEKNIRAHPKSQIEEFQRSVEQLGQFRPIIIDENNLILAGNGLYQAMKEMGRKKILADRKTGWSEVKKKKLMIADNRIFELGMSHNENLFDMFEELNQAGDLDIPGYEIDILKDLLTSDDIDEKIGEYGKIDPEALTDEEDMPVGKNTPQEFEITNDAVKIDKKKKSPYIVCPECSHRINL